MYYDIVLYIMKFCQRLNEISFLKISFYVDYMILLTTYCTYNHYKRKFLKNEISFSFWQNFIIQYYVLYLKSKWISYRVIILGYTWYISFYGIYHVYVTKHLLYKKNKKNFFFIKKKKKYSDFPQKNFFYYYYYYYIEYNIH